MLPQQHPPLLPQSDRSLQTILNCCRNQKFRLFSIYNIIALLRKKVNCFFILFLGLLDFFIFDCVIKRIFILHY